jgi:hypothetical protein
LGRPFFKCFYFLEIYTMWKIAVGFVLFAALGMLVIIKGGDNLDMSGEKHGGDTSHAPAATPAADATASAAAAPLVPGAAAAPAPAK